MNASWNYIILIALSAAALASCGPGEGGLHVTGEIDGHSTAVGSLIGGRIEEVLVEEGADVKGGDVLVRIEADEARADLAVAKANLAALEAQLAKLEAGTREEEVRAAAAAMASAKAEYDMAIEGARSQEIAAARAQSDAAKAEYIDARDEFERTKRLYEGEVVSVSAKDHAQRRYEAAEKRYDSAREQLDLLIAGTRDEQIAIAKAAYEHASANHDLLKNGPRIEDIDAARASRDAAAAQVERAEVALRETEVVAPWDGVVEALDLRPGDIVKAGPVARLTDPEDLELRVYVGAAYLGHLSLGQKVTFTTDAHGDERFDGRIEFIATEGEFTPRNLQTREERVQQVFEVKIGTDSAGEKLRPGMAGTVEFEKL